jgi:uncharacterized protein YbbC (DUF1343 family)
LIDHRYSKQQIGNNGDMRVRKRIMVGWILIALSATAQVTPGIDVFLGHHTHLVKGLRVGLLTNQTGKLANGRTTIDALHEHPDVDLRILFSPEHGIRGKAAAGIHVTDTRDRKTGLPIFSLYGGNGRRPPQRELDKIDVLIYDIQDVGSRAYTYIWSMALAMDACAEYGRTLIVMDRPNPLGSVVDGSITEDRWQSFIGMYPIPRVYGMTPGELALYFNTEQELNCRLVMMPMAGYRRQFTWAQTGLKWTGPSPNIPTAASAVCFPATGTIGTLGFINIGIGTAYPFQLVGAEWIDNHKMAKWLNDLKLPGASFQPVEFMGKRNTRIRAVHINVTDIGKFHPSMTEIYLLYYLQRYYPSRFKWPTTSSGEGFDKAMGTTTIREALQRGDTPDRIVNRWRPGIQQFLARRAKYLQYP